jgi:hypothetical protein
MAIGLRIAQKQMARIELASLVRFECQLKCGDAEGLMVVRLLLQVDVGVVEVEELEILMSLEKTVKCWHL